MAAPSIFPPTNSPPKVNPICGPIKTCPFTEYILIENKRIKKKESVIFHL